MSKTAVITGASWGIGYETAKLFAINGYNVVIGFNNSKSKAFALETELTQKGYNAKAITVNVANSVSVNEFIKSAVSAFGHIDVLINNAGIAEQKLFTQITDENWHNMINTNLSGVFYCCRAAAKHFINQKSGSIVNVSSMWGETGASMEVHYSAAKAGVIGLTKALAKELGPSNIRVNCITPGVINTKMNEKLDSDTLTALSDETPLCRIGKPEEVAKAIYFLANDGDFITGQILGVNGGIVI